jgi:pyrimidine operon attenuation protein/uracil phosphoribosyltransferase
MEYIKVKGHDNFFRDPNTNSIINTNMHEYNEYISRKKIKEEENQKIQNLECDVANIRDDLNEIKTLLRSLLDGSR